MARTSTITRNSITTSNSGVTRPSTTTSTTVLIILVILVLILLIALVLVVVGWVWGRSCESVFLLDV